MMMFAVASAVLSHFFDVAEGVKKGFDMVSKCLFSLWCELVSFLLVVNNESLFFEFFEDRVDGSWAWSVSFSLFEFLSDF